MYFILLATVYLSYNQSHWFSFSKRHRINDKSLPYLPFPFVYFSAINLNSASSPEHYQFSKDEDIHNRLPSRLQLREFLRTKSQIREYRIVT